MVRLEIMGPPVGLPLELPGGIAVRLNTNAIANSGHNCQSHMAKQSFAMHREAGGQGDVWHQSGGTMAAEGNWNGYTKDGSKRWWDRQCRQMVACEMVRGVGEYVAQETAAHDGTRRWHWEMAAKEKTVMRDSRERQHEENVL